MIAVVARQIYVIRDQKVMLDAELAELYQVSTGTFNQAIKRNFSRFPKDFRFQLTATEAENLRSQIVISSHGGRRYRPYVFTEQGVAMLSSILKSGRAVQVNIAIMRAFVKLREIIATHKELADKIQELEQKFQRHDGHFETIFQALKEILEPRAVPPKRRIGFTASSAQQNVRGV